MNTHRCMRGVGAALCVFVMLAGGWRSPAAAQTWGSAGVTVTPLPEWFAFNGATAIVNDAGQVAGHMGDLDAYFQAYLWSAADGPIDLGLIDLGDAALGINNAGQVVGVRYMTDYSEAFLWSGAGDVTGLGTLGGSSSTGLDVNEAGQVVGLSDNEDGVSGAFFWSEATGMISLDTARSVARAINDAGQVAGTHDLDPNRLYSEAFLWSETGGMTGLGNLTSAEFSSSYAQDLNAGGQVVGYSYNERGFREAFFWSAAGGMIGLGGLDEPSSNAVGIDDAGHVVGYSWVENAPKATLWENNTAYAFDDIVGDGWTFSMGEAISDNGRYVAAVGSHPDYGEDRYVLLEANPPANSDVVPEPATFLLLATGLLGLVAVARWR